MEHMLFRIFERSFVSSDLVIFLALQLVNLHKKNTVGSSSSEISITVALAVFKSSMRFTIYGRTGMKL